MELELRLSCTNPSIWKLPDILMVIWVWPKYVIHMWFYIISIHVTFSILPKFIISSGNVICDMMLQKVSSWQELHRACFNIKMVSHWYRKSHSGVKTASRSSYLQVIHKIILSPFSYTGMITALYCSSTFITVTSWWTWWHLKSLAERASNAENVSDCLLNCLFRHRSQKTSKLRATVPREGNPPVTGGFPSQRASDTENVFIWLHDMWIRAWGPGDPQRSPNQLTING